MKNLKVSIAFLLALLAVFIIRPTTHAQASPNTINLIGIDAPKDRYVLSAIAIMYAPTPDNHLDWLNSVCQNMTEGGCGYFTDNLESLLWMNGQDVELDSAWPIKVVATLDDGSQVWKAAIAIYRSCEDAMKNCPPTESNIYIHVVFDGIQDKWLLNRVLYGPFIDFPQFEDQ